MGFKEKEDLIKRDFLVSVTYQKVRGWLFGLVLRIISSMKMRTTKILDYEGLIINYFRKSRVGGIERD